MTPQNAPSTMLLCTAGSGDLHEALTGVVALFGAALVVAWLMRAIRLPTILGFLLAGIAIGPAALHVIQQERVTFFAEMGLVLLLFVVGLELSPGPLLRMGSRLLAASALQIVLTAIPAAVLVALLLSQAWSAALITGIAVALSSTAIVLKHLSDRGETGTPAGALTTGILLVQDIAVILVLILLPFFARSTEQSVSWAFLALKIVLALAGLVVVSLVARLVMPVLVNMVFRYGGEELMTLFAIVMACVGAWLASLANWSWPLGSFIAGLLLAQTDVRHQLRAEITPFRDAFNALFFISIGMLVDLDVLRAHALPLTIAVLATLAAKTVLTGGAIVVSGWPTRMGLTVGLGLCTISEFGFVLVSEAGKLGLVPPEFGPLFVTWTAGTMLLGALLVPVAGPLATRVLGPGPAHALAEADLAHGHGHVAGHVIIVGYGINGQNLGRVLKATGIRFSVIEMNRTTAQRARRDGADVIIGDAARRAILEHAGLPHARALVVAIADQYAVRRIVDQAHRLRPDLYILARTRYIKELETLYRLGAHQVIPEEFETSVEIFAHVLKEFAIPDNVITQQVALVRSGHYGMLRGRPADERQRRDWLAVLEAAVTQTYLVQEGSPAVGQSLRELELRARTGVTIIAVTRAGQPTPNPSADFRLAAGDVLVLVGTHKALDATRASLDPPPDGT